MAKNTFQVAKRREAAQSLPSAYASFLRDKRCVLVGPAAYLQGLGRGEWIDSHDVVIRVNWGESLARENPADYGSRTDVLYKRLLKLGHTEQVDVEAWERDGIHWIIAVDHARLTMSLKHLEESVGERIPWLLDLDTRGKLRAEMRTSPLIGPVAVSHLLERPLGSLILTGFDFYASGYGEQYGGTAYRQSVNRAEGTIGPTHDAARNLAWLQRRRSSDSRLTFDERLNEVAAAGIEEGTRVRTGSGRPQKQAIRGVVAIIPARYESSRFPGKPLAEIDGVPMVVRVCQRARVAVDHVVVATDDERIRDVVTAAGYEAVMTRGALTGTDRVAEAAAQFKQAAFFVNVQGDEPLIEPDAIKAVMKQKQKRPREVIGAMTRLDGDADRASMDVVKVAASGGRLLYCSRAPIAGAAWRQVGLYAFNGSELQRFREAGRRTPLEAAEDVEILRFLELKLPVRMADVKMPATPAVDRPEDIAKVEAALRAAQSPHPKSLPEGEGTLEVVVG